MCVKIRFKNIGFFLPSHLDQFLHISMHVGNMRTHYVDPISVYVVNY